MKIQLLTSTGFAGCIVPEWLMPAGDRVAEYRLFTNSLGSTYQSVVVNYLNAVNSRNYSGL